jgi:deoxyguanosine kinase
MPGTPTKSPDQTPIRNAPCFIAVEGPIRVGKPTLARFLAERMYARRVIDCEDNPFLSDFYQEKRGAAFSAQMYFLMERHRRWCDALSASHQENVTGDAGSPRWAGARGHSGQFSFPRGTATGSPTTAEDDVFPGASVISDFLFEKDKIFAYLNLDNEELKLYERYFERFSDELRAPDLVIYLQATPGVLRERIAKKAAPGESRISREYIESVVQAYEHFFFRYSAADLLIVNTSEIDFVDRNVDLQPLLQRLEQPVKGTQYFLTLGDRE